MISSEPFVCAARNKGVVILMGTGLFTATAICLYWLAWFMYPQLVQSLAPADHDYNIYVAYENAFLLADAWLASASLIGVAGLWKARPWGLLFMLIAAGAAIFLGLMDFLFNIQHGIFLQFTTASVMELLIVGLLVIMGGVVIYLVWVQWQAEEYSTVRNAKATTLCHDSSGFIQRRPGAVHTAMAQLPRSDIRIHKEYGRVLRFILSAAR